MKRKQVDHTVTSIKLVSDILKRVLRLREKWFLWVVFAAGTLVYGLDEY